MTTLMELPAPWNDLDWNSASFELADLSWWGGDYEISRATDHSGTRLIAKTRRAHLHCDTGALARSVAAVLGVGPEVVFSNSASPTTIERELGAEWAVGTLWRVRDLDTIRSIGAARARFRGAQIDLPARDLGEDVARLLDGISPEARRMLESHLGDAIPRIREALADGPEPVPGWLSAEISDVMIRGDGSVLLTGGSRAGIADPLADVGAVLAELSPLVADPLDVFAALWGDSQPGAYERARLWGVIADLRDYLWAERASAMDPESPLSYGGYRMRKLWRVRLVVVSGELDSLITAARAWEAAA